MATQTVIPAPKVPVKMGKPPIKPVPKPVGNKVAVKAKAQETKGQVTAPAPDTKVSSIAERAMLVGITIRRWHPHATDQKIGEEVAQNHQSDRSMGKYRKRLLPKNCTMPVATLVNELRSFYYLKTLPWSDDGSRVLSREAYFDFQKGVAEIRTRWNVEVDKFLSAYPGYVDDAKVRLKDVFDPSNYPTIDQLKKKFAIEISVRPIPSGKDLRVDVGDEETARIRREIDAESKATIDAAMQTVWGRLKEVVEHAATRLKAYTVTKEGKTEHAFRESLVTNITELLDLIPQLNVTDDSNLKAFSVKVRAELTQHTATELRDDEKIRKDVATKAEDILSKMAAFLS